MGLPKPRMGQKGGPYGWEKGRGEAEAVPVGVQGPGRQGGLGEKSDAAGGRAGVRRQPSHLLHLEEAVPGRRRSGTREPPTGQEPERRRQGVRPPETARADPRGQAATPLFRLEPRPALDPADAVYADPIPAGPRDAPGRKPPPEAGRPQETGDVEAPILRAGKAEPPLAVRHHHFHHHGGSQGLPDRLPGRPLAVHGGLGIVRGAIGEAGARGPAQGDRHVREAAGNPHRQRAAVQELARGDGLPAGAQAGRDQAHHVAAAPSADPGEDRVFLGAHEEGVAGAGIDGGPRLDAGAAGALDQLLQFPEAALGNRERRSRGAVFPVRRGAQDGGREANRGERAGAVAGRPVAAADRPDADGRGRLDGQEGRDGLRRVAGRRGAEPDGSEPPRGDEP